MKNWKTTLWGAISAVVIVLQPLITTGEINWTSIFFASTITLLGYFAKDNDVTGGTVTQ